ncbi:hypothetical protein [Streptomyces sp. NPDC001068]|uniref:hypothetical protein n=1 Tax=Streptomyces sp. NPDC001068 TaxID=3364544 RepID=UPI0036AAA464
MSTATNPDTGDGFDAPTPDVAYAAAPDLRQEMYDVMALGAARDGRRRGVVVVPSAADGALAERIYLLRRAALLDRMAIDDPAHGARGFANKAAFRLAAFDRDNARLVAGPHGPMSIEFDPGQRPYVRQEYAAWTAAGQPGT